MEARKGKSATIEPNHFLVSLCQSVDLDLVAMLKQDAPQRDLLLEELLREVRRLRTVFRAAGLDAREFRHELRSSIAGNRMIESESARLRRSAASKETFTGAERYAEVGNSVVYPIHLLIALLATADRSRDGLMRQHGGDPEVLRKASKNEIIPTSGSRRRIAGKN